MYFKCNLSLITFHAMIFGRNMLLITYNSKKYITLIFIKKEKKSESYV